MLHSGQEDETAAAKAAAIADKTNLLSFTLPGIVFCQSVVRWKIATMRYTDLLAKWEMAATTIQQTFYGTKEVDAALKICSKGCRSH